MTPCLTVGIMGAGRMAQGFDAPGERKVLSLAHAVKVTPNFVLGGFFDTDPAKAVEAEKRWGCGPTPRDRTDWLSQGFDVICIATPDDCHARDLEDVLKCRPRAIVVEKPIATDHDIVEALLKEARHHGVPLIVDFPRRFHTGVDRAHKLILEGVLGRPRIANLIYSGSALHSAVHMVDLLHTWFGHEWQLLEVSPNSTPSRVILDDGNRPLQINLIALSQPSYYVWEMKLFFERGSIELGEAPESMTISRLGSHPEYPGFQVAIPESRFNMEGEPLLERLFARVEEICRDPNEASMQLQREMGCQRLLAKILGARGRITHPKQLN